jgi:hypothetical protein
MITSGVMTPERIGKARSFFPARGLLARFYDYKAP